MLPLVQKICAALGLEPGRRKNSPQMTAQTVATVGTQRTTNPVLANADRRERRDMPREELFRHVPILKRHWPDFPPSEPLHSRDLFPRRTVGRLHDLSVPVMFEILTAVGAERGIATYLKAEIGAYTHLDPMRLRRPALTAFHRHLFLREALI